MKKMITIVIATMLALLQSGCDNAYDGEKGLIGTGRQSAGVQASLEAIRQGRLV